jgi:SPP1 gp7 family putative phage head morphogenesis protein
MAVDESDIIKVVEDRKRDIQTTLITQAETIVPITVRATAKYLSELKRTAFTKAVSDGITREIVNEYAKHVKDGGTMCVERILTPVGGGKVRATTKHVFVPWLDDMAKEQQKELINLFGEAERLGIHPREQAKLIESYFEGTRHRAVTAARTEAQKLRTDARMASYRKSGVKYVQYITAGDEAVRPEHAARDGKIYPINKAPWLGEYNCRCILTEADFAVEELGMETTKSEAEIIPAEDINGTA